VGLAKVVSLDSSTGSNSQSGAFRPVRFVEHGVPTCGESAAERAVRYLLLLLLLGAHVDLHAASQVCGMRAGVQLCMQISIAVELSACSAQLCIASLGEHRNLTSYVRAIV